MGLVNAVILLTNPKKPELEPVETEAQADSEGVHLCITEHISTTAPHGLTFARKLLQTKELRRSHGRRPKGSSRPQAGRRKPQLP